MKKKISFRTNLFEAKQVKPKPFRSEQCFGEDLAAWIIDKLRESEISFSEPYPEDWGWEIGSKKDEETFFIRIDLIDESIGDENAAWTISIENPKSLIFFGRQNSISFEKLCREIAEILTREPRVTEITLAE